MSASWIGCWEERLDLNTENESPERSHGETDHQVPAKGRGDDGEEPREGLQAETLRDGPRCPEQMCSLSRIGEIHHSWWRLGHSQVGHRYRNYWGGRAGPGWADRQPAATALPGHTMTTFSSSSLPGDSRHVNLGLNLYFLVHSKSLYVFMSLWHHEDTFISPSLHMYNSSVITSIPKTLLNISCFIIHYLIELSLLSYY